MKRILFLTLILFCSSLHAEESLEKTCNDVKEIAHKIMQDRQDGVKPLDLLKNLLMPMDETTEDMMSNYYLNNFYSQLAMLSSEVPVYKTQSEKDEAAVQFGLRAERICLKDVTALFAPVRFQEF